MYYFWSFFTNKKNFSFLILIALVVSGLFSLITIQKESNPEVNVPIGFVITTLPGASATDVESLVTNEIEKAIVGTLDDVNQITSVSSQGVSQVTVEFNANADLDKSIQDLKDEVDTAVPELPEEANDPFVQQIDFSQDPVLTFAIAGDLPLSQFAKLGRQLQDELETVSGVSNVSLAGAPDREIQVVVNPEALRAHNLTLSEVVGAIRRSNVNLPVGSITQSGVIYNLQFDAEISDPAEVGNIVVKNIDGQLIYVRDVALVSDGLADIDSLSRVSIDSEPSQPSLSFNVQKRAGSDVTDITRVVNERLAELQEPGELLEGIEVLTIFDTGELLQEDLTTLTSSGLIAVALVMTILLLVIGWRESLVAGLSIPLSFMIAFVGLLVSGNTLNFVSLFALILSVGILVDSAIVIVEGIHTNMKADPLGDKKQAALKTIAEFHGPVTAGTMTTVAVFVPLFFISGIVGEFIKSIPFTVISVLVASLVVALGFIPLIASLLLRRRTTSRLEERQEHYTGQALAWYKEKLQLILGHRRRENLFLATVIALFFATPVMPAKGLFAAILFCGIVGSVLFFMLERRWRTYFVIPTTIVALAVAGFVISFLPAFATLQVEFFPGGDEDYLIVEVELPQGTVLETTEIEARKVEEFLYQEPDIESFVMTVGASSAFSGDGGSSGAKFANAFIQLKEDRELTSLELGDVLSEKLSVIKTSEIRVNQLAGGPPVGTPVVITFKGDDLDVLDQLAVEAGRILTSIDGTSSVTTSTKNDSTEFVFKVDKDKAILLGLEPALVAETIRTAVYGSEATTINTNEDDIDVIVKLALNRDFITPHDTNETTIDTIKQIEIPTPNGSVLLGSVIEADIQKGSAAIRHRDEKRISTASSQLAADGNVAEINAEFAKRAEAEMNIPENVEMIIGGENEETDQSFAEMGYAIIAGLILMFSIIVLMFNSFRHALYVLAPAFLSFIGITIGLTITGNALSFPSLMGLIALIGIVVNNSIILIDVMNKLRRDNPGWLTHEVVLNGAASRLRPIVLTTITTVIGIIPLLFASSLWAPLALSIIFGLSFSVVITLVMIPIIYHRNPGQID